MRCVNKGVVAMETSDFYFDVLIEDVDYCNRKKDFHEILKLAQAGRKFVIYAPRRYGKSSLVKNLVGKEFQKKKNCLTIYVNLMEVDSLESIGDRFLQAIKDVLKEKFPYKSFFSQLIESMRGITISISVDPLTQLPSIDLRPTFESDKKNLGQILGALRDLARKYQVFLILDEFQDIADLPQAQGLLRAELQEFKTTAVAMLGSKKEMLNQMFSNNGSPFFNFGSEMTLSEITVADWVEYFNARLKRNKLRLDETSMQYLCSEMNQVPNSICEVGAHIKDHIILSKLTVMERGDIARAIGDLISRKESVYRMQEGFFTESEKSFMKAIAKNNYILKPTEKRVLQQSKLSSSAVVKIVKRLTDKGWIEFEDSKGYRISDPLFSYFLKNYY